MARPVIRGQLTAAPLKPAARRRALREGRVIRGQLIAAPLKRRRSLALPTSAAAVIRGQLTAAPLKRCVKESPPHAIAGSSAVS